MTTAFLQLHQRESFERTVLLALGAGAVSGLLGAVAAATVGAPPWPLVPLIAVGLSALRGDWADRLLLALLAVVLPLGVYALGMTHGWTVGCAGAALGVLLVRANLCERGEEGQLGRGRPGAASYLLGAGLGAALAGLGDQVSRTLGARLLELAAPGAIAGIVEGASAGLFLGLSAVAAHLALRPDPVEARCEELLPTLPNELQAVASRALDLYRRCGEVLSRLPRHPDREAFAQVLSQLTRGAVELASEWAGVEGALEERTGRELQAEVLSLRAGASTARDDWARRQLLAAADALEEEVQRVEALRLRRERVVARLRAQVALLERARVALLGLRSGHAQLRGAELSALAQRFSALARAQGDEGALADEAASGAELEPG